MSASETVADRLASCLLAQSQVNGHTSAPVAAVLWSDKDGAWAPAIARLQALLPELLVLGPYAPALRQDPAIWLKCAIAGALPELGLRGYPSSTCPV